MLVVSRKKNETVVIDNRIEVTIVEVRGDKVRLGFQADVGIPIHRKEVWLRIKRDEASGEGNAA